MSNDQAIKLTWKSPSEIYKQDRGYAYQCFSHKILLGR